MDTGPLASVEQSEGDGRMADRDAASGDDGDGRSEIAVLNDGEGIDVAMHPKLSNCDTGQPQTQTFNL